MVRTNGRCAHLRTSTEDGTCHLETTVVRLRKTNLPANQDHSFSAPNFRFLRAYLYITRSTRARQNKSPLAGVRFLYEQCTRTAHSLVKQELWGGGGGGGGLQPKKTERYRKFQIWDWFFSVFSVFFSFFFSVFFGFFRFFHFWQI